MRHWSKVVKVRLLLLLAIFPLEAREEEEEKAILEGRAFVPFITSKGHVKERFFSWATVTVIDLRTGKVMAEGETEIDGSYEIYVPPQRSYLIQFQKDAQTILDVCRQVEKGKRYNLSFADARSTAMSLVLLHLFSSKKHPDIIIAYKANRILREESFPLLQQKVLKAIARGKNPEDDPEIQLLIDRIALSVQ